MDHSSSGMHSSACRERRCVLVLATFTVAGVFRKDKPDFRYYYWCYSGKHRLSNEFNIFFMHYDNRSYACCRYEIYLHSILLWSSQGQYDGEEYDQMWSNDCWYRG